MSAILNKLLRGQNVEWKTIGDLGILNRGKRLVRSQLGETGAYPVYQNSLTPLGYFDDKNTLPNTTFIIAAGAAGEIGHSKSEFWAADDCYFFKVPREKLNDKFIYYFLLTQKSKIVSQVRRASVPRLGRNSVENIAIPIPPLDVQAEIVRILDAFTAITAELTQELAKEKTLREKQYQYYRDKLLSFSKAGIATDSNRQQQTATDSNRQQQTALCEGLTNNVKQNHQIIWKSLGEVVKMQAGKNIKASQIHPSQTDENLYPCFGGNGIRGYVNNLSHQGEYVIIGRQGALCGNVQRVKGSFYATEHAVVVTVSDLIDVDWAYHMLSFMNLNQYASKSAQPGLAVGKLEQLEIPVPNLSEQKRVAKILDKLDTITHSITEGLPKEINLRQRQYEYYREQLIDFPKN